MISHWAISARRFCVAGAGCRKDCYDAAASFFSSNLDCVCKTHNFTVGLDWERNLKRAVATLAHEAHHAMHPEIENAAGPRLTSELNSRSVGCNSSLHLSNKTAERPGARAPSRKNNPVVLCIGRVHPSRPFDLPSLLHLGTFCC